MAERKATVIRCFWILIMISVLYIVITISLLQIIRKNQHSYTGHQNTVSMSWKAWYPSDVGLTNETLVASKNTSTRLMDTEMEKIDWNDYNLMNKEAQRKGIGEHGKAAFQSLTNAENKLKEDLLEKFRYNAYLSDAISVERSIGDLRTDGCRKHKFIRNIPENSVSVICVFHNERNSTLLRTIYSIVNRTPVKLLREIILVDDKSSLDEIKAPLLETYLSQHFTKVRVIRNTARAGLIRSRIIGADASSGIFLLFLDAHVEVNYNYLPPLLEPMMLNYKTITCPMVDFIHSTTFQCNAGGRFRGVFDWSLGYQRIPVYGMDETTPHASPVMVGCAFAITKQWWEELGKYDSGLEIWGAEQYELSFKSWQCGGSLVDAPCSRVAHIFRPLPYVKDVTDDNVIERNFQRLTSVWMDEFKEFVLKRRPLMLKTNAGNITQQLELRKRLKCKSFKWYLEEIAADILTNFPPIEPPNAAWGKISGSFNTSLCIVPREDKLYVDACEKYSNNRNFLLTWRHHIIVMNKCVTISSHSEKNNLYLYDCSNTNPYPQQMFSWNRQTGHIVNFNTSYCVDVDPVSLYLFTYHCDSRKTQSWQFSGFNATKADRMWALDSTNKLNGTI